MFIIIIIIIIIIKFTTECDEITNRAVVVLFLLAVALSLRKSQAYPAARTGRAHWSRKQFVIKVSFLPCGGQVGHWHVHAHWHQQQHDYERRGVQRHSAPWDHITASLDTRRRRRKEFGRCPAPR